MHTKKCLINQLEQLRIDPKGTLTVHTAYKSMGAVEGGPDTVIDALMEYMQDGLLVLPSHTWDIIGIDKETIMDVSTTPVCIGAVPERFRHRPGVFRSFHPTHSVAAYGAEAESFISGNEYATTPCGKETAYYKLLERNAQILLIGVNYTRNTFIHGIEEWMGVPNRLTEEVHKLYVRTPDGILLATPQYRHNGGLGSETYWKIEPTMERKGALWRGQFGDAAASVTDCRLLFEYLSELLAENMALLSDQTPMEIGS